MRYKSHATLSLKVEDAQATVGKTVDAVSEYQLLCKTKGSMCESLTSAAGLLDQHTYGLNAVFVLCP